MKNFLKIGEAPPVLEQSFKAAGNLTFRLPRDIEIDSNFYGTFIFSCRYSH